MPSGGDRRRDRQRGDGELDRRRQPFGDDRSDGRARVERVAEVEPRQAPELSEQLLVQRPVGTEPGAQAARSPAVADSRA